MNSQVFRYASSAVFGCALIAANTPNAAAQDPVARFTSPPVIVTAQKEPADVRDLPVSVTAVPEGLLLAPGLTSIADAAVASPNTFFSEFTARKLSFPRFRGIFSGPGNPAITTYVDGVPMLHSNASNVELMDVQQIEFVRGSQSSLFGRNALGGIINIASPRPSLSKWTGSLSVPLGNYGDVEARGTVSGPISNTAGLSFSAGRSSRDGFTTNDVTGHAIDSRQNTFAKAQLLWTPSSKWETRVIVSGERARDGDYALGELNGLRQNPFHVQHDFEGSTDRDITSATILNRHEGSRLTFSTITGIVDWSTTDETDLDYSPYPFVTRRNQESARQFTQEVRLASSASAPLQLSPEATLRWQAGFFLFTNGYNQLATNTYAPMVLSQFLPFQVTETSPDASLDDMGIGVYGQGTLTLQGRIDLTVGARVDRESKDAAIDVLYSPLIAAPTNVDTDRSFSNVSPQASIGFHLSPEHLVYGSFTTGYKSGGFNPTAPSVATAYAEEHTWQFETGVKTTWAEGRVQANAAFFYIDWDDLQVNVPNPQSALQFYLANVAGARSTGVEFEVSGRAAEGLDLFAAVGLTSGRFADGSFSGGINVSDNRLTSTPDYTTTIGARYSRALNGRTTLFAGGEVAMIGAYQYDDANTAGQDAYALTNINAGVQIGAVLVDGWIRNAFDTRYVPLAFAYPGIGFLGEMGRPRTFGVRLGVRF